MPAADSSFGMANVDNSQGVPAPVFQHIAYEIHKSLKQLAFLPFATWRIIRVLLRHESLDIAGQKLGLSTVERSPGPLIWFHASTLGDCTIAMPVIHRMVLEYNEKVRVLLTVSSPDFLPILASSLPRRVVLQLRPSDHPQAVAAFLAHWRPSAGVVIDMHVSPVLAAMAREAHIPLAMLDAHLPKHTFFRWHASRFNRAVYAHFVHSFALIVPQSDVDVGRFRLLGSQLDQMPGWCSDLNCASKLTASVWHMWRPRVRHVKAVRAAIASRPAWIASDIAVEEEPYICHVHHEMKKEFSHGLTFIVPRTMFRCPFIVEALREGGAKVALWSQEPRDYEKTDVFVVDSYGQLPLLYAVCEIAFVGSTLVETEHPGNVAHAAVAGCAVLCGLQGPENVRVAEELNNAANVTAEESANAVFTAGVHTDDFSPTGAQPSPRGGAAPLEGGRATQPEAAAAADGAVNLEATEVQVLSLAPTASVLTQPHSAPAASLDARRHYPFGRAFRTPLPAGHVTAGDIWQQPSSARHEPPQRRASGGMPEDAACRPAAAAPAAVRFGQGPSAPALASHLSVLVPQLSASGRSRPVSRRGRGDADADAADTSGPGAEEAEPLRNLSIESDPWNNPFLRGPRMSTELSANSVPTSPIFDQQRMALNGTPSTVRASESSYTSNWLDGSARLTDSLGRPQLSTSPRRGPSSNWRTQSPPVPGSPADSPLNRSMHQSNVFSSASRGLPINPRLHRARSELTRESSNAGPAASVSLVTRPGTASTSALAPSSPESERDSPRSSPRPPWDAAPRAQCSSVAHQILPPHQMMRLEMNSPMFGGGLPLSPRFMTQHARAHADSTPTHELPSSPVVLSQHGSPPRVPEASESAVTQEDTAHGTAEASNTAWDDAAAPVVWNRDSAHSFTSVATTSEINMAGLPQLPERHGVTDNTESLGFGSFGGEEATSAAAPDTEDAPQDSSPQTAPVSPVKAPFGLRQIQTRPSDGPFGGPFSNVGWAESDGAPAAGGDRGGVSPSAVVGAGAGTSGLRSLNLNRDSGATGKDAVAGVDEAPRRKDRVDASLTSTPGCAHLSSECSDCWAGTSPFARLPLVDIRIREDTSSLSATSDAAETRSPRLPTADPPRLQQTPLVATGGTPASSTFGEPRGPPPRPSIGGDQRVDISYTALRHTGEYILSATNLPYHPHGPAVWLVGSQRSLADALLTLMREPIERRSRGHAAAQGAARLATNLVSTVWDVVDGGAIEPALLAYEAATKDSSSAP